jgi:mono/diheme cytochrome c family protein
LTLASIGDADATQYDRQMSSRVAIPVLFVVVSGTVFGLAQLHPARPGTPQAAAGEVELGDFYRGETSYSQKCAPCHGANGAGGAGPRLADNPISLAAAKARIDAGGPTMPAALVQGEEESDVLAYLATILAEADAEG